MSDRTYHILCGVVAFLVWAVLFIRSLKRSDDPMWLISKWIFTAITLGFMIWKIIPLALSNPFMGVPFVAACGVIFAAIWRRSIANIIAKPFGSLYDGGDQEVEPRPMYSIAVAKRKKGKYSEAVAEIRRQLEKFPTDVEGHLLLAEIQAENLNDVPGAEVTIHRLCNQPGHSPRNVALALNFLADWHLKFSQDRDAAQAALEKIIQLCPDTEFSVMASQRIGRLGTTGHLLSPHDRQRLHLHEGVKDIGLLQSSTHLMPKETDPAKRAVEYVKHLEQHPLDTEAREELAMLYAEHFQRVDLAIDQLEQLVNCPNQPDKRIARWLNSIADLQIKHNSDLDAARATLQRIIEKFPRAAAAENAQRRLDLLKLSLKASEEKQGVKLGTYEQDIGLKR